MLWTVERGPCTSGLRLVLGFRGRNLPACWALSAFSRQQMSCRLLGCVLLVDQQEPNEALRE